MTLNTISFGGLGDSFIVGLKLKQLSFEKDDKKIEHLFVESNPKTCELIKEYCENFLTFGNFNVECDPDYQKNFFLNKWKDKMPINTTVHGVYPFPGPDNICLSDNFGLSKQVDRKTKYDVCLQVSAGANSSRHWNFDVRQLVKLLEGKGLKVAQVGTDKNYFEENNPDNFCCKTNLKQSANVVEDSKVYIGLSGFHTYRSLYLRIPNIHAVESEEHDRHYIFPSWNDYRFKVKYASLGEVVSGLRYWNNI